jgi:hypothetical protein
MSRSSSGVAISPREQFRGIKLDFKKDLSISFGDYVQAYRCPKLKNSMEQRTVGAIALCPMDNQTKSWIFFNLLTIKTFAASYWKLLPTPDLVIDRMNLVARGAVNVEQDDDGPPPLIDLNDLPTENDRMLDEFEPLRDAQSMEYAEKSDNLSNIVVFDENFHLIPTNSDRNLPMNDVDVGEEESEVIALNDGLRRSDRLAKRVMAISGNMTVTRAIRVHGDTAENAVKSELLQMLEKNVFEMVMPNEINGRDVIHSHMFLKEKRDQLGNLVKVKARLVAGGNEMDRNIYTEEKRTSPTVHVESIFMLLAYGANNGMTVSSIDIEGAFLESTLDIPVLMRLGKEVSNILVKMKPELSIYLNINGCLVVVLLRALYGLVVASQLWYRALSKALISFGLKMSNIDKCVFYGEIDGHEIILFIHVDDIGILKKNDIVVELLKNKLDAIFTKANVDLSNPLNFLGMNITNFHDNIFVDMCRFEHEACTVWGATGGISTPADHSIFTDDLESILLPPARAKLFHACAAKLLFLAKRSRPDILTAISVCCAHVTAPREQDWLRLDRVMRYLFAHPGLGLKFSKHELMCMKCYCDAAFACHGEYRSRTGIIILMNGGVIVTKSSKQTLTTRSTPESELVALSDGAAMAMGCKNFYASIGVAIPVITMMEDNKTALDYIAAGGPIHARTRYIGVKYYYAKQYIDAGDLVMMYCRTEEMLADVMTKPVMGALFLSLRNGFMHEVPKII